MRGRCPACSSPIALDLSRCNGNRPLRRRLREGKQPIPRPASAVDSCAVDGQGQGHRLHRCRSVLLSRRKCPSRTGSTSRWPASTAGTRRARRSVRSAPRGPSPTASWSSTTTGASAAAVAWRPVRTARATSTGKRRRFPQGELNPNDALPGQPARGRRASWRSARSAFSARARAAIPACVEACPTGARKFGNMLDPDSEIRYILENKRVLLLKQELNTMPKFFYFYGT